MGEQVVGDGALRSVRGEGEHDDDAAGAGGDGEGEGVEDLLAQVVGKVAELDLRGGLHLFRTEFGGLLIEQAPGDGGDDQAAGDLDDGEGDSEEAEQGGAGQVDGDEKQDGVDGDAARERVVNGDGRRPTRPKKMSAEPSGLMSGRSALKERTK